MATDFGTDVSTFPDLDPSFATMSGPRVLGEAIARRISTPRGALHYAPNYGTDVRSYLNDAVTPAKLAQWQREIQAECQKDERVRSAAVSLSFQAQSQTMRITIGIETADGPFTLVLSATAVSVAVLDAR